MKHRLFEQNRTILLAVSGGPDSMALLHFFVSIRDTYHLRLIALSVDHKLRGKESLEDLHYVRDICEKWNVEFIGKQVNVPQYMEETKKSTELAARELRYAFFEKMMQSYNAPILAMGHHGDDQVETMFMQLTKGIKPKGMPFKRSFANGIIIRPLLSVTKDEIHAYCRNHQIIPRLDPTNEETIYTRNAFRHHLVPFLKERNPNIHHSAQLTSEIFQEEEDYLIEEAKKVVECVATFDEKKDNVFIDIQKVLRFHPTLQRRAFHLILNYLYRHLDVVEIKAIHHDQLLKLMHSEKPNAMIHMPHNLIVLKAYDQIQFRFNKTSKAPYYYRLFPGEQILLPDGKTLSVILEKSSSKPKESGAYEFVCHAESRALPLIIRSRQNGDKLKIRGLGGSKKIKDVFIDLKIPQAEREEWPIVTDNNGQLLWLIGLKKGEVLEKTSDQWLRLMVT